MPREGQPIHPTRSINPLALFVGLTTFVIGGLIYITDRNPSTVMVFSDFSGLTVQAAGIPRLWGSWAGVLPDALHAFSFSLITVGVVGQNPRIHGPICLFWFMVNTLFEIGQRAPDLAMALIPQGIEHLRPVIWAKAFFTHGTYDPLDILAFALGSAVAFAFLSVMNKRSDISWAPS